MVRILARACRWSILALVLMAGSTPAEAATIIASLVPTASQDVDVPLGGTDELLLRRNIWGNVVFNGALIGTFVMRLEFELPNVSDISSGHPTPSVTLTVRLRPTPSFDTLIMQGTVAGPGGPPPQGILFFGNVTVATGSLAFLRGATFDVSDEIGLRLMY
jgi:hypothetical protein